MLNNNIIQSQFNNFRRTSPFSLKNHIIIVNFVNEFSKKNYSFKVIYSYIKCFLPFYIRFVYMRVVFKGKWLICL